MTDGLVPERVGGRRWGLHVLLWAMGLVVAYVVGMTLLSNSASCSCDPVSPQLQQSFSASPPAPIAS